MDKEAAEQVKLQQFYSRKTHIKNRQNDFLWAKPDCWLPFLLIDLVWTHKAVGVQR